MGGERQAKEDKKQEILGQTGDDAKDGGSGGAAIPVDQATQKEAAEERKQEGGYD